MNHGPEPRQVETSDDGDLPLSMSTDFPVAHRPSAEADPQPEWPELCIHHTFPVAADGHLLD